MHIMGVLPIFLLLATVIVGSRSENAQTSIPKCRFEDKECILKFCNAFYRLSANGIPEYNLVPTDPYELKNVNVETGNENSPNNVKIQFERANLTGISSFHFNKINGFDKDPRTSKFEMFGTVKLATISGPYRISGKFLMSPIFGSGHAKISFDNLKLKVEMKSDVETKNGKDYLKMKKMLITMETEKMRVNFENLFNNKELSDNMNAVLNENHDVLFKALQGPMQDVLGDTLVKIYAPVPASRPYADFFMEDE